MQSASSRFRLTAFCLLCLLPAEPALLAASPASRSAGPKQGPKQMDGDGRILHALNRLTFGPRPNDLEAVKALGLKRWFEAQLQPPTISDAALDTRLAAFPAMKLPQDRLMERYPSPLELRAREKQDQAKQDMPLPSDPVERAIYTDQMAFYRLAQDKKDKKQKTPGAMTEPDAAMAAPTDHEERLYSGLEAVKVLNLPPDARMSRLLAMAPRELIAFRRSLSPRELAELADGLNPEQKEVLAALPGSVRMVSGEVLQSRLLRDIYSERQLEAVMTDFWLNHFNVYIRKNQNEPFLLPAFERDVVRPNALGNFETLLVATARSPAMLVYLDNWRSIGPGSQAAARGAERLLRNPDAKAKSASGLNENYARELMELHTLGVNGGYTQADVTQVARIFTGWTIERPTQGAAYTFEPNRHEPGAKQVLGTTIAPGGEAEGLKVLHLLATSPATAKFISSKLAVRFVADDPPPALVDRMAKTFLATNGDIKAVLRTMFDSPEFWSPEVYRAKVKTPLEFVVSAARATGAEVTNAQPLVQSLDKLGMPLYGMQTPNGYSWKSEPWVSTGALVSRMNFALVLTGDKLQGIHTGLPQLLSTAEARVRPASLTTGGHRRGGYRKQRTTVGVLSPWGARQRAHPPDRAPAGEGQPGPAAGREGLPDQGHRPGATGQRPAGRSDRSAPATRHKARRSVGQRGPDHGGVAARVTGVPEAVKREVALFHDSGTLCERPRNRYCYLSTMAMPVRLCYAMG